MSGEFVTQSFEYDGGRQVTVYVPPDPPQFIVFAGDGQLVAQWGSDVAAIDLPPTMVVGVHRQTDETLRLHENSPLLDPERFAAHERFFVDEIPRWYGRDSAWGYQPNTTVLGVSASGELALALGLRRARTFGSVLCASPGAGYGSPEHMPTPLPRTYLVAGQQEPFFLENATRWATALRDSGAEVVMKERAGSHGDGFWREEFPLMVACATGR